MTLKSKTTRLLNFSLAGILVLVSGASHAYNDDYRRGYDQGYRDGAYATRNGAGDTGNWRARGGFEIESASYGARGNRCDLRDSLRTQWRSSPVMTIHVNNRLCGDPAPGMRKQLHVQYRCNNGPVQQQSTVEGRTMTLTCY